MSQAWQRRCWKLWMDLSMSSKKNQRRGVEVFLGRGLQKSKNQPTTNKCNNKQIKNRQLLLTKGTETDQCDMIEY